MSNIISVLSGTESIPGALCSIKFQALVTNKRLNLAYAHINSSTSPSGRDLRLEVGGQHTHATYDLPDGTEVGLVAERHTGSGSYTKRMLLRADHRAPYIRVGMPTSGHQRSTTSKLYIEGRFWVVPDAELDGKIIQVMRASYKEPFTVFSPVEELHPGANMPVVEEKTVTIDGEEKKISVTRSKRRMRL